ncbi:MAG TPA: diaminopimelate epimerase [Streptosporangiaceae bacterium]
MRFAKGHGTENDFVIILDPDGRQELTPVLAARLCDRRAGIGADGVLRVVRTAAVTGVPDADGVLPVARTTGLAGAHDADGAEWFMDYRNADGSLAEMCGNGIRVFARFLSEHGLVTEREFVVATRSGPRLVRLAPGGNVAVDMGVVTMLGPGQAVVGGQACEGLRIVAGNPHLACLVDQPLSAFDLAQPPELDPHQFPDGANVEVLRVTGTRTLAMRVHERGSGETRSCGTGAVAAAAAAAHTTGEQGTWQVGVPGGQLTVTFGTDTAGTDTAGTDTAWLTGPAVLVAEGDLNETWLSRAPLS